MRPSRACEENRHFIAFVGSSSDDRDKSRGPSIAINRDRYKSLDGPSRLNEIYRIDVFYDVATYPLSK